MEVTKDDIREVHERIDARVNEVNVRIDSIMAAQSETHVSLARIATKLEMLPKAVKPPARPCPQLTDHLENHKETRRLWRTPIIKAVVDLAKMAIVALITWLAVRG